MGGTLKSHLINLNLCTLSCIFLFWILNSALVTIYFLLIYSSSIYTLLSITVTYTKNRDKKITFSLRFHSMSENIRLAIVGGWSGGHITPLINLLDHIDSLGQDQKLCQTIIWFGEKSGMEYTFWQKHCDRRQHIHVFFTAIVAGKYRRETIWISRRRNIRDIFLFPLGIIQSCRHLWDKKIDVLFCKGGYVSLPVAIAARMLRIPVLLHESDTKPWLTNRIISKWAKLCFTGFAGVFPRSVHTWQILSSKLGQTSTSEEYQQIASWIEHQHDKKIILLNGGSLGAQKLYHASLQALTSIANREQDYACIVINGQHIVDLKAMQNSKFKIQNSLYITWLLTDPSAMGLCYRHADLGIVRGGTTTLAEAKLFDLPLVIVPLPITHDQASNAQRYVDHYGDSIISQHSHDFIPRLQREITLTKSFTKRTLPDHASTNTSSAQAIIYNHILSYSLKKR